MGESGEVICGSSGDGDDSGGSRVRVGADGTERIEEEGLDGKWWRRKGSVPRNPMMMMMTKGRGTLDRKKV